MPGSRGFTLWELILTIGLAGVISALGVPAIGRFLLDLRLTADVNGFVNAVQIARSEAAKRHRLIVLCPTFDRESCANAAGYEAGWLVFVNEDADRPPVRDRGEARLFVHATESGGTIRSNRPFFEFRPFLRRSTNGTVTFCDRRGAAAARAVVVSYTGRPRTTTPAPGQNAPCVYLP